jgi:Kef-type K+ transport system membrane component KefB
MISLSIVTLPLHDPILIITVMFLVILLSPLLLERIKVPGIAGLLIFGMLIDPHVFNIIPTNLEFTLFSTTGLLYLMFLAGLEIEMNDSRKNAGKSTLLGLYGFLIPMTLGALTGKYLLVMLHCEKPTVHSGTFGFCRYTKPKRKPIELEFLPTTQMN